MADAGHDEDHVQEGQRVGHGVHVQEVQRAATLWRSEAEMADAGHDADHVPEGQRVGHGVHVQDVQRAVTLWTSKPTWSMLCMTQIMCKTVNVLGMKFMFKTFMTSNVPSHCGDPSRDARCWA